MCQLVCLPKHLQYDAKDCTIRSDHVTRLRSAREPTSIGPNYVQEDEGEDEGDKDEPKERKYVADHMLHTCLLSCHPLQNACGA